MTSVVVMSTPHFWTWQSPLKLEWGLGHLRTAVFAETCELGMAKKSCSGKLTSIFVRILQISHQVDNGGKSDDGILGSASEAFACVILTAYCPDYLLAYSRVPNTHTAHRECEI